MEHFELYPWQIELIDRMRHRLAMAKRKAEARKAVPVDASKVKGLEFTSFIVDEINPNPGGPMR